MNKEKVSNRFVKGKVVSDKMDKTVTVLVERLVKHAKYGKYIKRTTKLHAHDENNACKIGDTVKLVAAKPYSKLKAWKVIEQI